MKREYDAVCVDLHFEAGFSKMLNSFSRDELRKLARKHKIPRGQNKSDTIKNLCENVLFLDVKLSITIE